LFVGWSCGGDAAEVAVFEPVAVAFERDDLGVVDESVDHGGGDDVVAEHFAPAIWGWLMFLRVGLLLVPGQKGSRPIY
jgi:hypothetical protein